MAKFQIHEEKEKENDNLFNSKNSTKILIKNQTTKRSTFTVLNNIVGQPQQTGQQGKKTFRDIKSKKLPGNDENFLQLKLQKEQNDEYTQQQHKTIFNKNIISSSSCETKCENLPSEKLTFSVYEDNATDSKILEENKLNGDSTKASTSSLNNAKNIYDKTIKVNSDDITSKLTQDDANEDMYEKAVMQIIQSSGSVSMNSSAIRDPLRDITIKDVSLLDTSIMSFSETSLSPMAIDDDNDDIVNVIIKKAPRNDRERFFEVEEYQNCILEYYRETELKNRPGPRYMSRQQDINHSMRTILVDWLVEVSEEYRLHTETLFLAVSYVDRFLSYMSVVRGKLQLVGTSTMFIAAKYEEIYPPDVGEFVFITDDTYTKEQVLRMEQVILKVLSFDLSTPTSYIFINTYAVLYNLPEQVKFLATYLCELSLLEGETYLKYLPSQISSASIALARYCLDMPMWDLELEAITTYKLNQLNELILNLINTHVAAKDITQQAIQEKYKHNKYMEVSKIKPINIEKEHLDEIINEQNKIIDNNLNDECLNDTDKVKNNSKKSITVTNNKSARKYFGMM